MWTALMTFLWIVAFACGAGAWTTTQSTDEDGTPIATAFETSRDNKAGLGITCGPDGWRMISYLTRVRYAATAGRSKDMLARLRVGTTGAVKLMFAAKNVDGRLVLLARPSETGTDIREIVRFLTAAKSEIVLTLHNDMPDTDLKLVPDNVADALSRVEQLCGLD